MSFEHSRDIQKMHFILFKFNIIHLLTKVTVVVKIKNFHKQPCYCSAHCVVL